MACWGNEQAQSVRALQPRLVRASTAAGISSPGCSVLFCCCTASCSICSAIQGKALVQVKDGLFTARLVLNLVMFTLTSVAAPTKQHL